MSTEAASVVQELKGAKQKPIGFAFGIKKDGNVLITDKQKTGEQLLPTLKRLDGITQSCFGEASSQGSEVTFICAKPVHDLGKQLENWGKANKWVFKAVVTAAAEKDEDEDEGEDDNPAIFGEEQVKHFLVQAKTKEMFFAFGLGNGKASDLLALHPRRQPDKLLRLLRATNGAIKRASGTVTVGGGKATFQCLDDPFSAMKRTLRRLFKEWKLPLMVVILGPKGEEFDEADEEGVTEASAEQATAAPEDAENPEIARMRAQLDHARPKLDAAAAQDPAHKTEVERGLAQFEAAARDGDATKAREALLALAQLTKAPATTPVQEKDPALVRLRAQFENARERLVKTFTDAGQMDVFDREVAAFEAAEAAGTVDQARAALDRLAAASKDAGGTPPRGSLVALQKSRLDWDGLRKSIQQQLQDLQKSITAAVQAHNADETSADKYDEDELADSFTILGGILDNLDTRLIDKLDSALNAEGDARQRLQEEAAAIVGQYRTYVDSDPLIAEIDQNGFLALNIRAQTQAALGALARQL